MKFLPPDPDIILYEKGFDKQDILGRKKVGDALSELVNRIDDPVVIALHGAWGTGKSYFLKRWVGAHQGGTAVYFDAFAHDYANDPLPALISALAERLPKSKGEQIMSVKETALKVVKPVARVGLSVMEHWVKQVAGDAVDVIAEATGVEVTKAVDGFWSAEQTRQKAMEELRTQLTELAKPSDEDASGASLVIVIDELDRCRPDYALELLEVIKHFFSVPHLHFVLGVNLEALENSVRARYGEKIDAANYLKKFINISLELPAEIAGEQVLLTYLDYLIREMEAPKHIAVQLREQVRIVSRANSVSLRDVGKILSSVALANHTELESAPVGWIGVVNDLIIAKIVRPDLYPKFLNAMISEEELEAYFGATPNLVQYRNPEFDWPLSLGFQRWKLLVRGGAHKFTTRNNVALRLDEVMNDQFHSHDLQPLFIRAIPKKAHQKYLDTFSFFEGSASMS